HRAAVGDREHGDGVGHAFAHHRGAVHGVDGEVALRPGALADLFAVDQHRPFVFFAFADHHDTTHRDRVHQFADGFDGGAVAALFIAAANPTAGGHRTGFGDAYQFQGQVAVGGFAAWPRMRSRMGGTPIRDGGRTCSR